MKNNPIIDSSYRRLDEFIAKQTQNSEVTGEVYLAAGGYYQNCYIAIFEELVSTDDSRIPESGIVEANVEFIAELFVKELIRKFPDRKFPFNKIVSVTLPSQIIAKAIHKNLRKYSDLRYYNNNNGVEFESDMPKLIRLASYYSFSEEVQFKNIIAGDKVLVVNDVISTGKLIKDIHDSIASIGANEDIPNPASVMCVLSVVDSRVSDDKINIDKHKRSIYFNSTDGFSEKMFLSLVKKEIFKFHQNPHPDLTLVRINPILNARITIESRHSEEDKIAFKKAEDFLKNLPIEAMTIGHFTENSLHHQYFFRPEKLFKTNAENKENIGVKLVRNIYKEIVNKEQKYDLDFFTKSISYQLNSFEDLVKEYVDSPGFEVKKFKNQLENYLNQTKKIVKSRNSKKSARNQILHKTDFVFYPVFSGIESDDLVIELDNIFGVHYSNIIPLQRFDTNKGWRFIIPQKSYNSRLKGRKALILDMGSFTGESIIQMIDALCVFELKKIIVISLIGRLEDFNREFLSRIREMKVKVLNQSRKYVKNFNIMYETTLAPVNIYFGTNLHFPASQSTKICEHCKEIASLITFKELKEFQTTSANVYINYRIDILKVIHVNDVDNHCPKYFPQNANGTYDILTFFIVRDHLGKIDGYRFYTDYYIYFDKLKENSFEFNKKIEAIIAVTLHEKHLIKTIENQLPDVKQKINVYLNNIIKSKETIPPLFYKWSTLSLLEAYFLFNKSEEIFIKTNFITLLEFISKYSTEETIDFSFISFKIAELYRKNINYKPTYFQNELVKSIKEIWHEIEDNQTCKYFTLITEFNRLIVNDEIALGSEEVKAFYHLFNMYDLASGYKPSHSDLGISINNLITSIVAFNIQSKGESVVFNSTEFKKDYEHSKKELLDITQSVDSISKYLNSLHKLFASKKFAPEYLNGEKSLSNILQKIDEIVYSNLDITSHLTEIQKLLETIEFEYFSPSSKDNFYSLWKNNSYISIKQVLEKFKNWNDINSTDFFSKYVDYKRYSHLITTKFNSFTIFIEDSYKDVGANIHPFLLIKICKELIDNAIKYAEGSNINISLRNEYIESINVTYSVFLFSQNTCSKGIPAKGLSDVQKIINDFNGKFDYLPKKNCLDIMLKIPVTQYKTN